MNVTVEEINPIKMMFMRQVNLQGLQAAFYKVINGALSKSVVLEEELKLQVVMKWTGHSDYAAMKPYIDIADQTKINAMAKFNML